jgi:hypothetical protein
MPLRGGSTDIGRKPDKLGGNCADMGVGLAIAYKSWDS